MGHTLDPSTGKPTFNNSPSTVSDLQAAADFAEQLGDSVAATVAELEDIEYPRVGEQRYVIENASIYVYNGTGWDRTGMITRLQLDTTNSVIAASLTAGVGKATGSGTTSLNEVVTFPVAFASTPVIVVSHAGYRAVGTFNHSGLTYTGGIQATHSDASATGFTVRLFSGSAFSGLDFYYTWMAIGVPA